MNILHKLLSWFSALEDDGECVFVTVHKGDSLWKIADDITGDGSRWREIADANPDEKWSQDFVLKPGQELRVPKSWADQGD